jgi:hypothetical protein
MLASSHTAHSSHTASQHQTIRNAPPAPPANKCGCLLPPLSLLQPYHFNLCTAAPPPEDGLIVPRFKTALTLCFSTANVCPSSGGRLVQWNWDCRLCAQQILTAAAGLHTARTGSGFNRSAPQSSARFRGSALKGFALLCSCQGLASGLLALAGRVGFVLTLCFSCAV